MILTVYKRFHFYKDSYSRLVTTLYRDGLVYMACILSMLVNLFMISYGSDMNHAVASVANIFVLLFAPVRLYAP
jgi:hypothetical protein